MIEAWSRSIAVQIKSRDTESNTSIAVLTYAIGVYLNFFLTLGLVLLSGWVTGELYGSLLFFAIFCLIRPLSGGYHFKSLTMCTLVSTAIVAAAPHVELTPAVSGILTGAAAVTYGLFAPSINPRASRMKPIFFPYLRAASFVAALTNFYFQSDLFAIALAVQAFSILPFLKRA